MNWFTLIRISEFIPNPNDPDFGWDIESVETNEEAIKVLQHYGASYQVIRFDKADSVLKYQDPVNGNTLIWSGGIVVDPLEFVYSIGDYELDNYVTMPEENFWEGIYDNQEAYHATSEENAENILAQGLQADCQTRGISNRGMGCAVFASFNEHAIEAYGGSVFAINLGEMKRDGFMPEVSGETPLEEANHRQAIAHRLGIEDADFASEYASEGLDQDTIAIYDNIPAKYIRLI